MSELQIFNYNENNVRTVQINNEPWFVASDVCKIFNVKNGRNIVARLDDDEKDVCSVDTPGGKQNMTVVNESGLYHMMFTMEPKQANGISDEELHNRQEKLKLFKRWVTSEVLPSIRKHGAYMTEATINNIISNPEFGIQLLTTLKQEQDKRKALELENAQQKQQLIEAQPKLEYVDQILSCTNAVNITQIAKDYGMGGVKMNKLLHDLGIQYKQNGQWLLYEKYAKYGYTKSKTNYHEGNDGSYHSSLHTKWTQKGRMFLYEKLKSIGIVPKIEQET